MALLFQLLKFRGWKRPPFSSLLDSCPSPSLALLPPHPHPLPPLLFPSPSWVLYSRNELQSLVSSGSTCLSNSRDDYRYRWENVGQTSPLVEPTSRDEKCVCTLWKSSRLLINSTLSTSDFNNKILWKRSIDFFFSPPINIVETTRIPRRKRWRFSLFATNREISKDIYIYSTIRPRNVLPRFSPRTELEGPISWSGFLPWKLIEILGPRIRVIPA